MAQNERVGSRWSQPPRSAPAKGRTGCSRGLGSDIDDIGDIVSALSCGDRKTHNYDSWQSKRNAKQCASYALSDCCLKKGLMQCHCSSKQGNYLDRHPQNNVPKPFNCNTLPYEKKSQSWSENLANGCFQDDSKMLEEFILDDREIGLLNYYGISKNVPKRRHVRNAGNVKTVSIIDTLSELASGATDREDEGGFSSAVSESAVLNRYIHKPKARHPRQSTPKRPTEVKPGYVPPPTNSITHAVSRKPPPKPRSNALDLYAHSCDEGTLPCSSLQRTLKYLRKAVASNALEEQNKNRRLLREKQLEEEALRQCFSDSEVREKQESFKVQYAPKMKLKTGAIAEPYSKTESLLRNGSKSSVPEWILEVFEAAKKGDVDKMKLNLKGIDAALVRNLSDNHGNNLWHICAVHNNFECLNWLCTHNQHHADALKDENKNGFSPAALAVKHGSLLAVQWLIHNTLSKAQLLPQVNSRSLLHVAARYGQYSLVEWLLNYMSSQDLDASIVDSEGNTALHLAAKYGHFSCVKALVFEIGHLKAKNECGFKSLDLAVKHEKKECADFLAAVESCYNLASLNLRQTSEIQILQKENMEMKNNFKELLLLTKRLQHRQKELVESLTRMNSTAQFHSVGNERKIEKNNLFLDDYSQLLATVMTDEEHHLLMVENKWKKSRKQSNLAESKKRPLDILRSQFNHVLEKVDSHSLAILSTPDTSDGSSHSDDDLGLIENSLPVFSPPDVINSLLPQPSVPYFEGRQRKECSSFVQKDKLRKIPPPDVPTSKDINLQMFFKQNPDLRQSGETCSVLEVLEPSSSDSEECSSVKKRPIKSYSPEKDTEPSSESSTLETRGESSGRPSSSDSKASGSGNGGKRNSLSSVSRTSGDLSSTERTNVLSNTLPLMGNKHWSDLALDNAVYSEPDLIKSTQKKKIQSAFTPFERERKLSRESKSESTIPDIPGISTDSESLEADRSFASIPDCPQTLNNSNSESSTAGPALKKKSFLFKFALRGKWPSKSPPQTLKKKISPEEFRETYSRSASADPIAVPSQLVPAPDPPKNSLPSPLPPKTELESLPVEKIDAVVENNDVQPECSLTKSNDVLKQTLNRKAMLPPRREPPPAPPIETDFLPRRDPPPIPTTEEDLPPRRDPPPIPITEEDLPPRRDPPPIPPTEEIETESLDQEQSDDDVSIHIQKSSISSCIGESLNNSYLNSRSSDLWETKSNSHFRPPSSASRVDRGEDNFPLNKSSSASTEVLSTLDSSTAGRHSPAPSEVSKTESALSPPSEVSKTESARYLSQLGKIEETGLKSPPVQQTPPSEEPSVSEVPLGRDSKVEVKPKKSRRGNSNKPWYEFSDEEDVIVPQRYKSVSVHASSSEDEQAVTG